jgi:hypothetical protein
VRAVLLKVNLIGGPQVHGGASGQPLELSYAHTSARGPDWPPLGEAYAAESPVADYRVAEGFRNVPPLAGWPTRGPRAVAPSTRHCGERRLASDLPPGTSSLAPREGCRASGDDTAIPRTVGFRPEAPGQHWGHRSHGEVSCPYGTAFQHHAQLLMTLCLVDFLRLEPVEAPDISIWLKRKRG